MKVTAVKIHLAPEGPENLKAFASITFDSCFVVHDLRIIKKEDKIFVAMPSKRKKERPGATGQAGPAQNYQDIAHPINKETREEIHKAVLGKYEETVKSMSL